MRYVDMLDGFETNTAPSAGSPAVSKMMEYASTADFVTAKGSAASEGDFFKLTGSPDLIYVYRDGAWHALQNATEDQTEDTAPAVGDYLPTYDISATAAKRILLGAGLQAGLAATGMWNVGLANATTTNTNDSIKIQGAAATLSATNPLYINLPTVSSPGRVTRFSATADVTLNLTGAHWGMGTNGDFSNIILRLYAINDNGTLKWGVSNEGGKRSIVDTNSHTTATSCTTQVKMLVNSALTAGTWPCREVGWFLANFDDTGGAAEDLWAVQTGAGQIMVGVPAPVYTDWAAETFTHGFTGGTNTVTGLTRQKGSVWECKVDILFTTVFTGGSGTITFPSGRKIDTTKMVSTVTNGMQVGRGIALDAGNDAYEVGVNYNDTSSVLARNLVDDVGAGSNHMNYSSSIGTTAPFTWGNNDRLTLHFEVPILGWSGN